MKRNAKFVSFEKFYHRNFNKNGIQLVFKSNGKVLKRTFHLPQKLLAKTRFHQFLKDMGSKNINKNPLSNCSFLIKQIGKTFSLRVKKNDKGYFDILSIAQIKKK